MPIRLVAFRRQPRDRAPRVEHRLPAHLHRARDVGADDVVGAGELGRHPLVVIRQAQAQRAHAVPREQAAQADVAARVGVPLRQHEHRGPPAPAAQPRRRKVAAVDDVVFRMRRVERARERQPPLAVGQPAEAIGVGGRRREKRVGVRHRLRHPAAQNAGGLGPTASAGGGRGPVTVRPNPVQAPLEGAHDAVRADGDEPALPGVEEFLEHFRSCYTLRAMSFMPDMRKCCWRKRASHVGGVAFES